MKSISSVTRLSFLLALVALPLGACVAPPLDPDDEHVGETEDELSTYVADTAISGQATQSAPALATYNYDAVMVHRGSSNNNMYMATYDGWSWGPETQIPGQSSKATVGLTQHGTKLHMAYLCGPSTAICYSNYLTGNPWSPPVTLSYTSAMPPALASDPISGRLMIAFVTSDGILRYAFNDGNWQNNNVIYELGGIWLAQKAPALAVHNGRIHMVFEMTNGQYRHMSFNGSSWEPSNTLPYTSKRNNPALASYAGTLYLFHRGYSDNKIWWSSSPDGLSWTADVSIPVALSQDSPAIAQGGFFLTLAHRANSGTGLWYSTFLF